MGETSKTVIRPAVAADAPLVLSLIHALAEYEREPDAVKITLDDLLRDAFGPQPILYILLAESDGQPAGFVLYFFNYSTWAGRPGLYIEDLFLFPAFRGRGLGRALFAHLAAVALGRGCSRLQWQVLDWNQPAIDFYQHLGAEFLDSWRTMRILEDGLQSLASEATQA